MLKTCSSNKTPLAGYAVCDNGSCRWAAWVHKILSALLSASSVVFLPLKTKTHLR